jgi:colanic acid biosynthesis glycosyl transferase WcaI
LLEAARLVGPNVHVDIIGEGNAASAVRREAARLDNVTVRKPVPRSQFCGVLASAHVDVVVQRKISAGANFPSKIASYLASGRPIIASIDADTPAAEVLMASGAALVVPPENPAQLASVMERLQVDESLRQRLGAAARKYAVETLDRRRVLPEFERAIVG